MVDPALFDTAARLGREAREAARRRDECAERHAALLAKDEARHVMRTVIFLHEMGVGYDEERGQEPYKKAEHSRGVQDFFDGRCR